LGLDYLGGDDTLSYAAELNRQGIKVNAVPKTMDMDNDVQHTEYCIGFSTAITRAMDAIERQRTTGRLARVYRHFPVFGRDAGYTALSTAHVTALRCCFPEYKVDLKHVIEILVNDKRSNASNYSLVILCEGAEWQGYTVKEYGDPDAFGHRKIMSVAEDLSNEIKAGTGKETVVSNVFEVRGRQSGQYIIGVGLLAPFDSVEWKSRVYYPGVLTQEQAQKIKLGEGEWRTDIDFRLAPSPIPS
jgi:6-phosphofructokinase 1